LNSVPDSSTKLLVVEIDSPLKFHIIQTEREIASSLDVLKRIRNRIDGKTSCMIYDTMILSCLNYCNILLLFGPALTNQICWKYTCHQKQ